MEPYITKKLRVLQFPITKENIKQLRTDSLIPHYVDDVGIIEYIEIFGFMTHHVRKLKAKIILELGTRKGNSTRILADACKPFGGKVYTIDKVRADWEPYDKEHFDNIEFVTGDIRDLVWNHGNIDILYIDADHDAFNVFTELERFGRKAKCIMLHDVYGEENSKQIREAIAVWCRANGRPFVIYPGHCGLGVISE